MADFKTHVTFSSVLGAGYAVAGSVAGMHLDTALVAGGLCGVAGMLPDVDSDSGVPRREAMGFAAAIVPMLMLDRFEQLLQSRDQIILVAALMYFLIRFTAAKLIGKFSVHRGMWHSIPAVLIFAGIAFLIAGPADNLSIRYFKAFAVGLGAMSHLVLDEVYSVDTRGVVPKFKKSFGTAVKFWGKNAWANFSTYAKLAVVGLCIFAEPNVLARLQETNPRLASGVQSAHDTLHGLGNRFQRRIGRADDAPRQPTGQPAWNAGPAPQQAPVSPPYSPTWQPHPQQSPIQQGSVQPQSQWRGFSSNAATPSYQPPAYNRQWQPQPAYPQQPARPVSPGYGSGFIPNRGDASGWQQLPNQPVYPRRQ